MSTEQRTAVEREHAILCHPGGGDCPDGCDAGALWCRCVSIPYAQRRQGWLVCGGCGRAIGGASL